MTQCEDAETGVLVVPSTTDAEVQITADIWHMCPFKHEEDEGTITLSWRTSYGMTLELHSLVAYLHAFDETLISHEDLVVQIREDLAALSVASVNVLARFTTAGAEVVVAAT